MATTTHHDDLLTPEEAARLLRVNVRTMANWRVTKRYPLPYVKRFGRVRYRRDDIAAFLADGEVNPSI